MNHIAIDRSDSGIATVWLDNPRRLNALSNDMAIGLGDALTELAADTGCAAVVLRGRSGVFCAGRDLTDLRELQSADDETVAAMYGHLQRMNEAIYFAPMPTISIVERYALGIGTMIATWTDITLAEEAARFGYPEVQHGITPYGAVPTMRNTMTQKGMLDLLLTGRRIDAREAVSLGIVTRAVPSDRLEEALETTLADLARGSAAAIRKSKAFVRACEGPAYRAALSAATTNAIASIRQPEMREGLAAFARKDGEQGGAETA
jgi:enoyl-CoA hydratase/carnithine racemase